MANPICLSPLKFYDDLTKQSHRKSYAYNQISPLIVRLHTLPPFQFVLPSDIYDSDISLYSAYLRDAKTGEVVSDNLTQVLTENGFSIQDFDDFKVAIYNGLLPISDIEYEGYYYLELASRNTWRYYSEVFCLTNSIGGCTELEYWNKSGNFYLKNGIIAFPADFHFKILLQTEVGKPEYSFEEEGTKRLGYNFIESQISKKIYKFNAIVPEYICDAMRLVRLCDNKIIRCKNDEFEALSFDMDVEWQTQGDLASINCEFETDNVIVNLGGFVPEDAGGDFNSDYNEDYDIE